MRARAWVWVGAVLGVACGGGDVGADGGMDARVAARDGGTAIDAGPRPDAGPTPTCEGLGGICGCVGGCAAGTRADPRSSLCPQPCDTCGGCSQECCLPEDAGAADAGALDACAELTWDTGAVLELGASCGATPDEGSRLCLTITVDDDGVVTSVEQGEGSDIEVDADALGCIEGMVVGRCVPSRAGSTREECAYGV